MAQVKKIEIEQAIVYSAYKLFKKHGYNGVKMPQIAAKSGISTANIYVYFKSKDELIERFGHRFPKDKTTGKTTASPKSFTFISATCLDNPPLLEANPDYVSTLAALPRITRERLL